MLRLITSAILLLSSAQASFADVDASKTEPVTDKIKRLEKWSATGNVAASYELAMLYIEGAKLKQDYSKAFDWMHKSAGLGHISAQYNLGLMYLEGSGTRAHAKLGLRWMESAAYDGSPEAQ